MSSRTPFDERMKSYEAPYMQHTVPCVPIVIRVEGCHFHTFTRGFARPFDPLLMRTMQQTMLDLCTGITGAVFGYTQSDEITVVCRLADPVAGSEYFEGRVQKILSVTASKTTVSFNRHLTDNVSLLQADASAFPGASDPNVYRRRLMTAEFDARVMNIPDSDLYNCLIWRQADATRNSLSMLAQSYFTQKELQGKKREDLMDMLVLQKGVNWNDLEVPKKRGSCCYRMDVGKTHPKWVLDTGMPILSSDEGRGRIQPLIEGKVQYIGGSRPEGPGPV